MIPLLIFVVQPLLVCQHRDPDFIPDVSRYESAITRGQTFRSSQHSLFVIEHVHQ